MPKIKPTEKDVKRAIKVILTDKKSYPKSLNYAVEYCRAGLFLSGEPLKTQVLYILNNITSWRGNGNKEVRQLLKDFIKKEE
ncbi:MAG: hypothetical protein GY714_19935 [Desulfobacterales bacterium]|nr:hypothetical protein [Desulfobacterales bacterium]